MRARVVITGANSAIGRVVVQRALARQDTFVAAAVRSGRAAAELPPIPAAAGEVLHVRYDDPGSLHKACEGAVALVHLTGLLIETPRSTYRSANVETARVAAAAARAAGVSKLVLLSACGASSDSTNRFWRSKGEAEDLVRESGVDWTIVRCPLVLGCDSAGDRALAREARSRWLPLLGGGRHLEQPVDARDVADGLLAAALEPARARARVLELVGPECLPVRELVARAAAHSGARVTILSVPLALARAAAALGARLRGGGGMTPDVIDVLTGHRRRDPEPAAEALGLELAPLDETIARSLAGEGLA